MPIPGGKPRCMKAIDTQRSKQLKQTKTPEVSLHQRGLVKKRWGESCTACPFGWLQMKDRRAVGQVEIIVDFEAEKIIGMKDLTAVSRNSKFTVVRANGQIKIWFGTELRRSHP